MLDDVLQEVIDVAGPSGESRWIERQMEKTDRDTVRVEFLVPGAFARALNESGWLADEAIAAGMLRQGKPPSVFGMVTGLALVELARPRRSKSLPREFVLAVTADRVVAFATSAWKEGEGRTGRVVKIKKGEYASWPRGSVLMIDRSGRGQMQGGTLELEGVERLPVMWDGDQSTDELIELLG